MDERDGLAQRFHAHRPRLHAVAYRLLGSLSDADDAVQEAWLRLARADAAAIDNLEAWLVTTVGRVALNLLRARARRREQPLDARLDLDLDLARLPDPIVDPAGGVDPEHQALLAEGVGLALLVVLEALTPAERLAYVLHDLFAVPFDQLGAILDRSPQAARQLASRGRRRVQGARPIPDADLTAQRRVVAAFLAAAREGDFAALVAVLDPDVVRRVDTGGGAVVAVRGAEPVARAALAVAPLGLVVRPALVNGAAGWVALREGVGFAVGALTVRGGRITTMDILLDPVRLARLDLAGIAAEY